MVASRQFFVWYFMLFNLFFGLCCFIQVVLTLINIFLNIIEMKYLYELLFSDYLYTKNLVLESFFKVLLNMCSFIGIKMAHHELF